MPRSCGDGSRWRSAPSSQPSGWRRHCCSLSSRAVVYHEVELWGTATTLVGARPTPCLVGGTDAGPPRRRVADGPDRAEHPWVGGRRCCRGSGPRARAGAPVEARRLAPAPQPRPRGPPARRELCGGQLRSLRLALLGPLRGAGLQRAGRQPAGDPGVQRAAPSSAWSSRPPPSRPTCGPTAASLQRLFPWITFREERTVIGTPDVRHRRPVGVAAGRRSGLRRPRRDRGRRPRPAPQPGPVAGRDGRRRHRPGGHPHHRLHRQPLPGGLHADARAARRRWASGWPAMRSPCARPSSAGWSSGEPSR